VTFGVELAWALAGLHAHGLVHRDIKPSNVILVGGVPKLADIGLVASTADAMSNVGTEGFLPPEGPGQPSADVFALGRLLYELATGLDRQEFPRLPPEMGQRPDRKLLLELNEIILRACEPDPGRRYHDASAMLDDLLVLQVGGSLRRKRTRAWIRRIGVALAVVAVTVAGAALWWRLTSATAVSGKSIAVLPFENRSNEKENEYFTDGIHDDILTNLARIADLRVVSRTSVMQYKSTTKTAAQIGQALDVEWLLEGSVQRAGNRVHVIGQLINARTDKHVWAQSYDRDLSDIFAIQSALAQEIATALNATISPREKTQLARRPTVNPEAYDLYLKARQMDFGGELQAQVAMLERATTLDPAFASAWAYLCESYSFSRFVFNDLSEARLAKAREAINNAHRLDPDNPDVIRGVGAFFYYGLRDYARALEQFERLARQWPNDYRGHYFIGLVQRRQGRWVESLANLRRAEQLDPASPDIARDLGGSLRVMRRYDEAIIEQERYVRLLPESLAESFELAFLHYCAHGSTREGDELFAGPIAKRANPAVAQRYRMQWAATKGDLATAARIARELPDQWDEIVGFTWIGTLRSVVILAASGDLAGARARMEEVPAGLRARLANEPENCRIWAPLAVADALLGHKEEALAAARKSLDIFPESVDAFVGPNSRWALAVALAWTGENEAACVELRRLLASPSIYNIYELKNGPWFAPLKGDPRFEAIVNDPKNNAPLF
jgi:TolB-like protein/cytochrome c-type biogenesis protein CcmH/NrfG